MKVISDYCSAEVKSFPGLKGNMDVHLDLDDDRRVKAMTIMLIL